MSQRLEIQRHLAKGLSITTWQAIEKFHCTTLSQRIREIKRDFPVESKMVKRGGSRVASYRFAR